MRQPCRLIVEAILYCMRVGCPWRDLPVEFGFRNSIYQQFNRWSAKNKLKKNSKTGNADPVPVLSGNQEAMLQTLKYYVETPEGRKEARERVKVEHALASICNRKGPRARYNGLRLNEYDLNRTAMITNLHIALNLAA